MYKVNLVEDGKLQEGIDDGDNLNDLLQGMLEVGWEDDPDQLLKGFLTFTTEDEGRLVAVMIWIKTKDEWPLIHVLRTDGSVKRYRRVEDGNAYRPEEIPVMPG